MKYRSLPTTILAACAFLFATACSNDPKNKNHGPIALGDSATIVTETDPVYLQDQVPDLRPTTADPSSGDAAQPATAAPLKDTASAEPAQPSAAQPTGNGLTIAFKELTVFIPNITARTYGKQDLKNARGATYELSSGNLAGNQLRISGGKADKVTQRYQTVLALQEGSELLPLESLGTYSSSWQQLNGSNGNFQITGVVPGELDYNNVKPAAIRNAVQQAARKARMSRNETQDWLDNARNVRSAKQKPCVVILRSISWRISGKDASGKSVNKEVRVDLPR